MDTLSEKGCVFTYLLLTPIQHLSYRDFGTYEIAPPPESIWASSVDDEGDEFNSEVDDYFMNFELEDEQETLGDNPMMPW